MSDARDRRRRKFVEVFNLACQIAARKAEGNVVLVSRPIQEGAAVSCRAQGQSATELRFYVRSDDIIFLVQKVGEEIIVGSLNDDEVKGQIANAIVSNLPL